MAQLVTTGERLTTLSVSKAVADTINKRSGALTIDNYLRKLLKMPLRERKRGRPPVAKKKKKTARKKAKR